MEYVGFYELDRDFYKAQKQREKTFGGLKIKIVTSKKYMNRLVYYDTGQINLDGCRVKKFISTSYILRKCQKDGHFYYKAELREDSRDSVIIVDLEKVLTEEDVQRRNKKYCGWIWIMDLQTYF